MIAALCHRIEAARPGDRTLDADILAALTLMPAFDDAEFVLRHGFGLAGDLTGVVRLLAEMLPGLRWHLRTNYLGTSLHLGVVDATNGVERPHTGQSADAANALLAAGLRAYVEARQAPLPVAVNDDVQGSAAAVDAWRAGA